MVKHFAILMHNARVLTLVWEISVKSIKDQANVRVETFALSLLLLYAHFCANNARYGIRMIFLHMRNQYAMGSLQKSMKNSSDLFN